MAQPPEDEWFPSVDPGPARGAARVPSDELWLAGGDPPLRASTFDPWSRAEPRLLVPLGLAVVFVVALLAAVGAFGGATPAPVLQIGTVTAPPAGQGATLTTTGKTTTTATTATKTTPTPPTSTLKPGDSGAQVKALQQELASLGYSVGTIDGNYGAATSKAVTAFQRAHHLTADGVVGPATLVALAP